MSRLFNLLCCVRSAFAIAAALCFVASAQAYTEQWRWQVGGYQQAFDNKQAAVAYMHSLSPAASFFTIETAVDLNQLNVTYRYTAPMKPPIVMTDWRYLYDTWFASEEEALAIIQAKWPNHPRCPASVVVPDGGWTVRRSFQGLSSEEERTYRITNRYTWGQHSNPQCRPFQDQRDGILRRREVGCPTPYGTTLTAPGCQLLGSFQILGRPLICPTGGGMVGNPCNVATGDKAQREVDVSNNGLPFERTYHSHSLVSGSALGIGWTHNYERKAVVSGSQAYGLIRPNGMHEPVNAVATGHYISTTGSGLQLKNVGTEWIVYIGDGGKEVYDSSGKLVRLVDAAGRVTNLYYTDNVLSSIVGPFGHSLQFTYDAGRIRQVLDPAGEPITYSYDTRGNLTQVTYPDGKTRTYHFEDPAFPNHLTGITDEANSRFATFGYDTAGRATLTKHAAGADEYTLNYGPTSTTVTDPLGTVTTYQFTPEDRHRNIVSKSAAGLTQTFSVPAYSTDFQRRTTQETDARGTVTRFSYDRDHLTTKTEAFGTARARTTIYAYRSTDDDRPTHIDEPGKRTTFGYDANGNLQTKTVTDTATGESRTWTYTQLVWPGIDRRRPAHRCLGCYDVHLLQLQYRL